MAISYAVPTSARECAVVYIQLPPWHYTHNDSYNLVYFKLNTWIFVFRDDRPVIRNEICTEKNFVTHSKKLFLLMKAFGSWSTTRGTLYLMENMVLMLGIRWFVSSLYRKCLSMYTPTRVFSQSIYLHFHLIFSPFIHFQLHVWPLAIPLSLSSTMSKIKIGRRL